MDETRARPPRNDARPATRDEQTASVSFGFVNGRRRPAAVGSGPAGIVDGGIYRPAGSSTPAPWVGRAAGGGARPILRYSTRLQRSGEVLHVHRSGCTADLRHPVERLCTIPLNAPMNSCPLYSLISAEQSSAYLGSKQSVHISCHGTGQPERGQEQSSQAATRLAPKGLTGAAAIRPCFRGAGDGCRRLGTVCRPNQHSVTM